LQLTLKRIRNDEQSADDEEQLILIFSDNLQDSVVSLPVQDQKTSYASLRTEEPQIPGKYSTYNTSAGLNSLFLV